MNPGEVKGVNPDQLKEMMDKGDDFVIVDVREPDELDICNLGGLNIPLGMLDKEYEKIPEDKPAIVLCRSGKRSYMAILFLQQEYQLDNLFNLNGGIIGYARDVDKSMQVY
jgi:rhodanese-related sulfurtransferase